MGALSLDTLYYMKETLITKADGSTEPFDASKLEKSLRRAGASARVIREIVSTVSSQLTERMTTKKIYHKAFALLRKREERPIAAKYSLKKAVFELGPSGFPFENFIAEIYRAMGYKSLTGVVLCGRCAEHQVDLVAQKDGYVCGGEMKFHNHPGVKTDLKVALYVYARFNDLIQNSVVNEGLLVTNTKFTHNAIRYGKCVNLTMISWDYPKDKNLFSLIGETGLHPITCLTTIPQKDKRQLLENKVVLCRDVKKEPGILEKYGVNKDKVAKILEEINALCQPGAGV